MSDLQERLDRAERALTRAGFTLVEGAQEWKPPIGPSASPLLDRIDQLMALLSDGCDINKALGFIIDRGDSEGKAEALSILSEHLDKCDAALAGKLPERPDTEWTDTTSAPTTQDYRELQAQNDQLQSRLKAALDLLKQYRENRVLLHRVSANHNHEELTIEYAETIQCIDALLAGHVPAPATHSHPMQPILLDPAGCPRFKKNSAVEYLAEGRLNEIACRDYSDEDMTQLAQLIGYSVSGFGELSYVSDADYERAMLAAPKPEGAA